MSLQTLDELKKALETKKAELNALKKELDEIENMQTLNVDLTKPYNEYLTDIEIKYIESKRAYEENKKAKSREIAAKTNEINSIINEIKNKLVIEANIDISY